MTSTAGTKKQSAAKTIIGTGVGNALEWYDWNVYASFAIYLSRQMFDSKDPASAFLATMAVFAVGFVARPFGGVVFGWVADHTGRKNSLTLSVLTASAGALLIALCPTYSQVGLWSSVILLVARILQGLAHGGELPSAQTYLAEESPREHRGYWASSIYVSGTLGLILGLVIGLILSLTLSEDAMSAWGWRVPFAIGAVLGLFALWMRSKMEESVVFEADAEAPEEAKENVFLIALKHWRQGLRVIGMCMGLTVVYYIWGVAMASLAQKQFGFDARTSFGVTLVANFVFIASLPLWGRFSDRFGRKPGMLIALLGSAVLYLPMTSFLQQGLWQAIVAISVMLVVLGAYLAIAPAVFAEMFPTRIRATGFGIPYSIAIAGFGGTAPLLLAAWTPTPWLFPAYAITLAIISALTVLTLPETKGKDLNADD